MSVMCFIWIFMNLSTIIISFSKPELHIGPFTIINYLTFKIKTFFLSFTLSQVEWLLLPYLPVF